MRRNLDEEPKAEKEESQSAQELHRSKVGGPLAKSKSIAPCIVTPTPNRFSNARSIKKRSEIIGVAGVHPEERQSDCIRICFEASKAASRFTMVAG